MPPGPRSSPDARFFDPGAMSLQPPRGAGSLRSPHRGSPLRMEDATAGVALRASPPLVTDGRSPERGERAARRLECVSSLPQAARKEATAGSVDWSVASLPYPW